MTDMCLLLDTKRKSYMESPTAPLNLIFGDPEGQRQGHSDLEDVYVVKEQSKALC